MKITKKNYPERLRNILNKPEPCSICAASVSRGHLTMWLHYDVWTQDFKSVCTPICRDFVKLRSPRGENTCPCTCLGKKKALTRAEKYLKLWDKGKHHWQQEATP